MLTVGVIFLSMFIILYVVFYNSMEKLLVEREVDSLQSQVEMAERILHSSVEFLPTVAQDWAFWDLDYAFLQGENDAFADEYLGDYPLALYRLNFIAYFSPDQSTYYAHAYDPYGSEFDTSSAHLASLLASVPTLSTDNGTGLSGFTIIEEDVYYLSVYPVLRTDMTGPSAGTLVFGRFIGPSEVNSLTESTGIPFALRSLADLDLTLSERASLLGQGSLVITQGESASVYKILTDFYSQKSMVIAINADRSLYQQGSSFISVTMLVLAVCCIAMLAAILRLLSRIIIRPLTSLATEVNALDMDAFQSTLPIRGTNREMRNLTVAVNDMLTRVKSARDTIQKNSHALFYQANFDPLTGLRNRQSTVALLNECIENARGGVISVFFFDLNRFKVLNDTMGHTEGDRFIRTLASTLRETFQNGPFLSRMGGDEFVIIVHDLAMPRDRARFAEKIAALFENPFIIRERQITVTASIGCSCYPADGADADTLLKNAEIAMFRAKEAGDVLYVPYEAAMQVALQRHIDNENRLRRAVLQQNCVDFRAYFQPKVSAKTREVVGCEALMRWLENERLVPPMDFIPIAEESGLIIPLTWWMIRECCRLGVEFAKEGYFGPISINVTAQVLLHEDFLYVVQRAVHDSGIDIRRLDIEIVEGTLVEDVDRVNAVLAELHSLGIQISVDDFGTGYSSLSYLYKISLDRLKIDQSFVSRINVSEEDRAIVNAIIAVAKSLHLSLTAEGVEDEAQFEFLRHAEVEEIQGYLFSKPVPADAFIALVKKFRKG